MPSLFYSMSLNAVVVSTLVEDLAIVTPMRASWDGVLTAKNQFIEETRSYSPTVKMALTPDGRFYSRFFIEVGPPSIPAPVETMSFDTFVYYATSSLLNGLNSGSNEWNRVSPLAAWQAKFAFVGNKNADEIIDYTTSMEINGMTGGHQQDTDLLWEFPWRAVTTFTGVKAADTLINYIPGIEVNGLFDQPDARYQNFTGSWIARTQVAF